MGGLFNTPDTMALVEMLNTAYQRNAFVLKSQDPAHIQDLKDDTLATKDFVTKYRLVLGKAAFDGRWKKWLDILDENDDESVVRSAMADALQDPASYSGIEFYAVPDPDFSVENPYDFPDQETGRLTKIIIVHTPTFDSLDIRG